MIKTVLCETIFVGTHWKHLTETPQMSTKFFVENEFYSGLQIVHSSKLISFFSIKSLFYVVGTHKNSLIETL